MPFYRQIADGLADHIRGGRLRPGDALPSVRALARELLVSVITTGRAYDLLEADDVGDVAARQARSEANRALREAIARARSLGLTDDAILQTIQTALNGEDAHA